MRVGIGFDTHRFKTGRRLVLGGVAIKGETGLDGHSDADVLCHAVIDALLGAVADGDIGRHFPDTDPAWKGACSIELLRTVARRLQAAGNAVNNVDTTLIAERPRVAPYADRMRKNIAEAIGIGVDRVSVKATTMEGMGALGRGEGIAAMAVASVEQVSRGPFSARSRGTSPSRGSNRKRSTAAGRRHK